MNSILVTGGAGFIGSHFVRLCLASGAHTVLVLDKLTYAGNRANLADVWDRPNLRFIQGDIGDMNLVRALLHDHHVQWVVNLAAETHVDRSIDGPTVFAATNVMGTCGLLEACLAFWQSAAPAARQRFRLVHVSTDEVFGALGPRGQFIESSAYAPNSPYAASKAAADHFVMAFHRTYGLPAIVTHCTNNYGPYQYPEKLIPIMVQRGLEGRTLPVYGDGHQVRDWIHVADHCAGLWSAVTRGVPGESYLFGGNCERSNLEVVKAISAIVDQILPRANRVPCQQRIHFVADRPGHDRRYAACTRKAEQQLGWRCTRRFDDGLATTVRWYLEHQDWVKRVLADVYDGGRLGLPRRDHGG